MRIKKFFEFLVEKNYDYDKILSILKKTHSWGLGILNNLEDFENNEEYFSDPIDENDYSEQFNIYLTDLIAGRLRGQMNKNHSLRLGKWKNGIPVANPTSIYNKLT